jgi:hypothetical protein
MVDCRRSRPRTNQALPQDEQGVDAATTTRTMSELDLPMALVQAVPCLVFAGSVVYAIVLAIQGDPGWWGIPLMGMVVATVSTLVTYVVLMLGFVLRWLLCYGGICRIGRAAVNAIRSATCRRPQRPSSHDMIGSCMFVVICLFWNGITWSMVFNICFIPNKYGGGGYSRDPDVPVFLLLFFLPFMLISVSLLFYFIFAGPLYHLSYYLLCCCCCCCFETGTAPGMISSLDMTKLEKDDDDDDDGETVATNRTYDESSSIVLLHDIV